MISTFLIEHAPLVRAAFWVTLAAAAVLAWLLHRLRLRGILLGLSGVSLVAVLVLTLLPDGTRPGGVTCTVQFSVPFQGLETLANVALLLPLVLFLGTATNRPLTILAGAVALSVAIEVVQALAPALGRRCDTNDWFMNTVGALLGAVVALVVCRIERRRTTAAVAG
ncbi:putative membrane protein YeaQ/YmgE (transglycosylase-associated protein family) [Curtobacterium flaccumfaciens]|uniref:Membrane protein YeaQ/YmgE (Transglycosylase-associated protein family) n=1 Tax=Curtobacterium salicis TaxID=1779862 RepID=A0ABX0TAP6_9MICO|nr:VanZ family protein [Curtobacterium sp. WW7]NII42581.1 putative membrane protein YeaQ/YmgE (transglycosylase-associated protein family) [Curtobacterium sp. WW7]